MLIENEINFIVFSEEVFDFGSQHLTQAKEMHLKKEFCGQFQDVFSLCITILVIIILVNDTKFCKNFEN